LLDGLASPPRPIRNPPVIRLVEIDAVEVGAHARLRWRSGLEQPARGALAALLVQEGEVVARNPVPASIGDARAEFARDEQQSGFPVERDDRLDGVHLARMFGTPEAGIQRFARAGDSVQSELLCERRAVLAVPVLGRHGQRDDLALHSGREDQCGEPLRAQTLALRIEDLGDRRRLEDLVAELPRSEALDVELHPAVAGREGALELLAGQRVLGCVQSGRGQGSTGTRSCSQTGRVGQACRRDHHTRPFPPARRSPIISAPHGGQDHLPDPGAR
jgi:hypothetical protein